MMILTIILSIVATCILVAELWFGIVVIGWTGDRLYLERSKTPGPYWAMMTLHILIGEGLPLLMFFAS